MIRAMMFAAVLGIAVLKASIVHLTDEERAVRAERLAHGPPDGKPPIYYWLDSDHNGGRDPTADHCATEWKDKNGKLWLTSDCVGFVLYTQGSRRKLKTFPEYSGAINTDSMLLDARKTQRHFKAIVTPHRGCIVTMPGVRNPDGSRKRPGHTGTVVYVDPKFNPAKPDMRLVKVAHCSPRHHKKYGQAIAVTDATLFATRDGWKFLTFAP